MAAIVAIAAAANPALVTGALAGFVLALPGGTREQSSRQPP